MDSKSYASHMERKLIEQFKDSFYEKIGYYPTVLTRIQTSSGDFIPNMSLEALSEYFTPYLPTRYEKVIGLTVKSRYRPIVELRNIFCFLARMMGYNLTYIGEFLGHRDHTTVIHNVNCCKNLLETNEQFREKYTTIVNHIKQHHESSIMDNPNQVQLESEPTLLP